jgi:hypothetical protein
MDDAVVVQGLETIWPIDRYSGEPHVWLPNASGMQPEPEMLRLELQYQSQEYHASMMRTVDGARRLGVTDEAELQRLEQWFKATPGWFVMVSGPGGRHSSSPYPTLEAAIVGALSLPALLWRRHHQTEVLQAETRPTSTPAEDPPPESYDSN